MNATNKKATVQEQNEPIRIQHVLVATDFSAPAAGALGYGKVIARAFGARMTLLHADPILAHAATGSRQYETTRTMFELANEDLIVPDTRWRLTGERPVDAILRQSRSDDADLIVMGTTGRTGVRRAVVGSVAERVIRESERPVLTIRAGGADRGAQITRILCPVNYTPAAGLAFDYALAIATRLNAELLVLYLFEEGSWNGMDIEIGLLKRWIGEVPASVQPRFLVERGEPAERVLGYIDRQGVDLLVIGAHRRRSGDATVIGSTTENLTRHASCAVLTVPLEETAS